MDEAIALGEEGIATLLSSQNKVECYPKTPKRKINMGAVEVPKRLVSEMSGHTGSVLVARGTQKGSFHFKWDVREEKIRHGINYQVFGTYCLSGSKDRTVRLWNPWKGSHINTYRGNGGDVRGLAVSSDNRSFLSCGTDRLVNHFDVATGAVIRRFSGHDAAVNCVMFTADETLAVSSSYDATVRFWDMKSRSTRPVDTVKVASDSVTGLAAPTDVPVVVCCSVDGTVASLDVRKGVIVRDDLHQAVSSVAAPADGLFVLSACTDSVLRLIDRESGHVVGKYFGHTHQDFQLECTLFAEDSVAACGSEDGTVHMWDILSKKPCGIIQAHKGVVTSICAVSDRRDILTAGADCKIKFWSSK